MTSRIRYAGAALTGLMLVAGLILATPALGCEATFDTTLLRSEYDGPSNKTHVQFNVDVSTEAACADISYELVVEVLKDDGTLDRHPLPRELKIYDGTDHALIEFEYEGDNSLNAYEARQLSCEPCDAP